MIRSCLVLSVSNLSDNRVCISGLDSEKLFPVILFAKYTDCIGKDIDEFLCMHPYVENGVNRHLVAVDLPSSDDDDYFRLCFPYKVDYVFYKCKDGKFRTYLR